MRKRSSQGLFSQRDVDSINDRGKNVGQVLRELESLTSGAPWARLDRPCGVGDGIRTFSSPSRWIALYEGEAAKGRASKFVPASGAASRMFERQKAVLALGWSKTALEREAREGNSLAQDFLRFIKNLHRFAFYEPLKAVLARRSVKLQDLLREGRYAELLDALLGPKGLNYGRLPKGCILYHAYADGPRSAFEEQISESGPYLRDGGGCVRLHLTSPREFRELVEDHLRRAVRRLGSPATHYRISLSTQERSTDAIAIDIEGNPLRDEDGDLVFRPAGHGALLRNLNRLEGDIVFVKTIDNALPERLRETVYFHKKVLGGILVSLQRQVFQWLERLVSGAADEADFRGAEAFLASEFSVRPTAGGGEELREVRRRDLVERLNRPIRVCGMVAHAGEPGGGPFWVVDSEGNRSLQIVERGQVDMKSPRQREIWQSCSHFNPADLVCGVRDYRGRPFDLFRFRDSNSFLIVRKSFQGREVKTLELPGLWNGGMAHWNTVFVEIPRETFHPVKTVLDLLSRHHVA